MRYSGIVLLFLLVACSKQNSHIVEPLFTDVTIQSGVTFRNDLSFTEKLNPYTYRNFYNGAGVAIGDINNDGLQDIYFAGNQVNNRLYLNQGNFTFKDISEAAGVTCAGVWSTGVTFVDINGDGLLDIYVCKSGDPSGEKRHNELFINNGDLTFTERSKEYGLDVIGLSVQAAFFDYDRDGDLDCYLLTNSFKSIGNFDLIKDQRKIPDPMGGGNKFFINDSGKFKDYTETSGIFCSNIGFGLGITLGDFNHDSWVDVFVSNDFFERDYLYINNQNGTFTESLTEYFDSISMGSMGADFADLDNDGFSELFVTEMLPDSLSRKKSKTVFETWDKHLLSVANGYHYQVSRNVLQKRVSDKHFVEIGRYAGVAASEWSWGALLFDADNDGLRDIFVANGIYKDLLDRDYLSFTGAEENIKRMIRSKQDVLTQLIDQMPSSSFPNYFFKNKGNLTFENQATDSGLGTPMFSCGSAYGDLDNDGDLDLVVNNLNSLSAIYKNNTDTARFKSLTIKLKSNSNNSFGIGSRVKVFRGQEVFVGDNYVTRGFQSSVYPMIHIGLGNSDNAIDSVVVDWPGYGDTVLYNLQGNKRIEVVEKVSNKKNGKSITSFNNQGINIKPVLIDKIKHQHNTLNDFNRDRLLPMMYSDETPSLTTADINGDGNAEIFLGGGKGQVGNLISFSKGKFKVELFSNLEDYKLAEKTQSVFFDADVDGDLDFYMASGGRFYPQASTVLDDKIFINDGRGNFSESPFKLPFKNHITTSIVTPIDFDNDADLDLFVGERFNPFSYGNGGGGFLFSNNGDGIFSDVTGVKASVFNGIGMVTDAKSIDIDLDGWQDLIVVGDWMGIKVLKNVNGEFKDISETLGLNQTKGWWNKIECKDLNKDNRPDFILGNHGANSFFKTGDRMYVHDFDGNGYSEQIYCTKVSGRFYPVAEKDELVSQMPSLKKSLLYYKSYASKSIEELFPESILSKAKVLEVDILSSIILLSSKNGYTMVDLPREAQFAPIYGLAIADFDNDGIDDLIAGGNKFRVKPQFGRFDASEGWFFKGVMNGTDFRFKEGVTLGVKGEIRDIKCVEYEGKKFIFFAKHDDYMEVYRLEP